MGTFCLHRVPRLFGGTLSRNAMLRVVADFEVEGWSGQKWGSGASSWWQKKQLLGAFPNVAPGYAIEFDTFVDMSTRNLQVSRDLHESPILRCYKYIQVKSRAKESEIALMSKAGSSMRLSSQEVASRTRGGWVPSSTACLSRHSNAPFEWPWIEEESSFCMIPLTQPRSGAHPLRCCTVQYPELSATN